MEWGSKTTFIIIFFLLTLQHSDSKTIVKSLPGFNGEFPFTFETGYVGIGDKEETQIFYYFVESERNPNEDPLVGPLLLDIDNVSGNTKLTVNPNSWTKMANIIFLDIPAGTGFSYATTKEASISSDSIMAEQAIEFLRKFLISHPKFLRNPLYISGISYIGIVVPVITLGMYNANERGDRPTLNIQGYILISPLTDKFMDFNSRFEFAHRMALISDDIYKSAIKNCHGDYFNTETANSLCLYSLQRYNEVYYYIVKLLNEKAVQQALNIREGTIGTWLLFNQTLHYSERKNDTVYYSYDIDSSFPYHKKLVRKNCRALIFRYETTYAQNNFSLTYTTIKGAGHLVSRYKPKEALFIYEKWLTKHYHLEAAYKELTSI